MTTPRKTPKPSAALNVSQGSVETAVAADLNRMAGEGPQVASAGLNALALALARLIDDPANSATSKSMLAGRLLDTLETLSAATPEASLSDDTVDQLAARRARRRARGA